MPLFWLLLTCFILAPCACFLLLAVSPRLFSQGSQWFTLTYLHLGLDWPWVTHAIMGPFGVVLLLGLRCVPFSFLAITAALAGLGQEFEDAARVHGASRARALRLIIPILAPAIWSAMAIGFAESISDFGVAATLASNSNFSLATYQLYAAIGNFPPSFPLAAGMGWLLVAAVALPLALQARALRGRSYAILSGRTRQAVRRQLGLRATIAATAGVGLFFVVAPGVPGFGTVSGSLLADYGGSFSLRSRPRPGGREGPFGTRGRAGTPADALRSAG